MHYSNSRASRRLLIVNSDVCHYFCMFRRRSKAGLTSCSRRSTAERYGVVCSSYSYSSSKHVCAHAVFLSPSLTITLNHSFLSFFHPLLSLLVFFAWGFCNRLPQHSVSSSASTSSRPFLPPEWGGGGSPPFVDSALFVFGVRQQTYG